MIVMAIVMKIAMISIASTGPLPRMVSVVEVESYLAQCALRMKLMLIVAVMMMMVMITLVMMIMMKMVMMMVRKTMMLSSIAQCTQCMTMVAMMILKRKIMRNPH